MADGVFAEVAWSDGAGEFIIGTSKLGSTDEIGGAFPIESWTDITSAVQQVTISRGRQDATSAIQASTCTITLIDRTGKYNAANQAGPLYGLLVASRPMRVYVVYKGVTYNLWTGVVSEIVAAASKASPYASISGTDLLERLSQEEPNIANVPSTTTGAAIGMVLDAVGWFSSRRSIAAGDPIVNFGSNSGQAQDSVVSINGVVTIIPAAVKALDLINQLLDHEGGVFFIDADGNAVYQDFIGETSVSGSVNSTNLVAPGVSISTIFNRAVVTASTGAAQEYLDGTSASKYGPRDAPNTPLTAQWLPDEASAAALAARLVIISQTEPVWNLTLQRGDLSVPANQTIYTNMISLDIGDLIAVNDPDSGTVGNCTIEGISHTIQSGGLDFETTWVLRLRTSGTFIIGHSELGSTDTLG